MSPHLLAYTSWPSAAPPQSSCRVMMQEGLECSAAMLYPPICVYSGKHPFCRSEPCDFLPMQGACRYPVCEVLVFRFLSPQPRVPQWWHAAASGTSPTSCSPSQLPRFLFEAHLHLSCPLQIQPVGYNASCMVHSIMYKSNALYTLCNSFVFSKSLASSQPPPSTPPAAGALPCACHSESASHITCHIRLCAYPGRQYHGESSEQGMLRS
jgi:hypothetical protein